MPRLSYKLIVLLFLTGILAGFTGVGLIKLLHLIQQLTFGLSHHPDITFRLLAEHTTPLHRLLALSACGLVAGIGWWSLHRYGAAPVNLKQAITNATPIPFLTTLTHGLLQIITVGMGSPLGRETAPREISAAFTQRLLRGLHSLGSDEKQLLTGCAAAAGLAAMYEAPLAGTVFALETLFLSWHHRALIGALVCCSTASLIIHLFSHYQAGYILPAITTNPTLIVWGLIAGPVLACAAHYLNAQLKYCQPKAPQQPQIILYSTLAFTLIGFMAMALPEILGNGKAGNELTFTDHLTWQYAIALLIGKWLALLLATKGGAYGGFITPAMMIGGLLAFILASLWNSFLPDISIIAATLIGATVFLGLLQNMPLTALLLMLELTRFTPALLLPLCLCLTTALITQQQKINT